MNDIFNSLTQFKCIFRNFNFQWSCCFLYSKLDKYLRRSQQWPTTGHQVAPIRLATVPQPQTVLMNGQTMRVVSNGNQQVVTTTNNPNMVVVQPSQTVRINQPPSYQVVI